MPFNEISVEGQGLPYKMITLPTYLHFKLNSNSGPVVDMSDASIKLGLFKVYIRAIMDGYYYEKNTWKK